MKETKFGGLVILFSALGMIVGATSLSMSWYEVKTLDEPGGNVTGTTTYYPQFTDENGIYDNNPTGPENSIELVLWTWCFAALIFIGTVLLNEKPLGMIAGIGAAAVAASAVFIFALLFPSYYDIPGFFFKGTSAFSTQIEAGPTLGWWWAISGFGFQAVAVIMRLAGIMLGSREE